MKSEINKAAKNIVACSILSTLPMLSNISIINAQGNIEAEFSSVANEYDSEDIIVENGVSIKKGETLDLSKASGWEISNDDTVKIDTNGIVRPINEGTVFLSKEINEKIHITEVHVSSTETKLTASARAAASEVSADRDYYKVFVDPGHGGNDNGASEFGYLEDELNLQVAKIVESKLKQKGIEVKMSRTSDVYLSLAQRAQMANSYGADVFISIHQNAADSQYASGIETYYHTDKVGYKPYSNEIQVNAIKETGAKNRGVKYANYVVLRETTMPSSLFEGGFISNKEESEKLADPVYQDKLASAIANGVETYLKENVVLSGKPTDPEEKPPVDEVIKTGAVTATSLNVRSGYGTSYSKIGSLSKGTKVEVVESKNGWYKIKYKSGYGCISANYVNLDSTESKPPTDPEEKPPVNEVIKTGEVNVASLNVRSGYGTSYSKIGSLSKGTKVEIVEIKNGWYKIKYKSGYGCISADYVNLDDEQLKPPTDPEEKPPTTPEEKPPVDEVIKIGSVTATSLNVRSGYSTSYSKIGSLPKGTKVEVVESENGWYKIKYKSGYGCISANYVNLDSTEQKPPTTPEEKPPVDEVIKTGSVTATSLNVRSGYSTSYLRIGSLSKGTKVEIVESKNGWYKIKYKSGYGCISANYVNLDSTEQKPPTTPEEKPPVDEVIKTGAVTATSLNVRNGYSTSYSRIGSLSKGTKVEIIESKNGWYKIKYKSGYGYVSGQYVTV